MREPLIDQPTIDEYVNERDDIAMLVRELRARQIELEIQNHELRQAQKNLADSRDRFWDLYDSAPVGYITLDREGIVREANMSATELLELNRAQLIGSRFCRFVSHACQESWHCHRYATFDSSRKQSVEITLRSCMGNTLRARLESTSVPLKDQDELEAVCQIRTAIIDQTEYRRAQALLGEQNERFVSFMSNSAVLAWMKDEQGRYVFLSENFSKRFSFTIEDIRDKTDLEIWPLENARQFMANDAYVLQTGVPIEVLEEAVDPDGVRSWWSSHKFPITDRNGNRFVGGLAVDMTQRELALQDLQELNDELEHRVTKRTAEAELRANQLQESEQRFRGVLDGVPDAIISMDRQGIITGINPATERIFGYVSSELIGESIRRLVPSFRCESSRKDQVFACEPVARRKNATAFPIVMKTNEVKPQGLIVAIIQDVSSRKALEKQVVDATTDEQRRIGYDIHDGVGQELTGLRYMAQTHAESLAAQKSADAQIAIRMSRWMDTVQRQLRGIIKQLVPVEIDQKGLAAALDGLARDTCELHDVQCVFESELATTVSDPARATQLFRIVQEAVNNAIRHSQADLIKILLDGTEDLLQLQVVDDGIGIDSLPDRRTGIGLSTMAYRAGLINADLTVERLDQGGTVVKCSVPQRSDFSF
jgi:PAS domain S-box-containing protein